MIRSQTRALPSNSEKFLARINRPVFFGNTRKSAREPMGGDSVHFKHSPTLFFETAALTASQDVFCECH
jgi:hypothetical protein